MAALSESPVFDPKEVTVIYVLGGPGAGKGTQCANLVDDYQFVHLSAGDLLRAEQDREGSEYGDLIRSYIKEGNIVPMEVTIKLLQNAMTAAREEKGTDRFLIDGFPRKMDQAVKFDESVCPAALVLFLTCTEEIMLQRLLERGKTSGRDDDNMESIKKRFRTFVETSMPVVDYYRKQEGEKVLEVDSTQPVEKVYEDIRKPIEKLLAIGADPNVEVPKAAPAATAVQGQDAPKPTEAERTEPASTAAPNAADQAATEEPPAAKKADEPSPEAAQTNTTTGADQGTHGGDQKKGKGCCVIA